MKKILLFVILTSVVTVSNAQQKYFDKMNKTFNKNVIELWPMLDSLRTLILEGKTGFASRYGKRLADGEDGSIRYAAKLDCLNADFQFISIKDGKEFYNIEWNTRNGNEAINFCYGMFDNDLNPKLKLQRTCIDFCMPKEPKDGWSYYDFREDYGKPELGTMKVLGKNKKTVMCIGPLKDIPKLFWDAENKNNTEWIIKNVAAYKPTGIMELDSFNIINLQGKIWQGFQNENPILNLTKIADNEYNNTVGAAYTAYDGSVRYTAPLWLGADSAYYVKDNKYGFGTKLYLFFAYGKPNTYQTIKNMRSALARNIIATTEGTHPFIFIKENGENPYLMYRNENTDDAPYKGLTILVSQTRYLKEKLAKQQAEQESIKRQNENRQNVNAEVKKKGILTFCKYCNGTGSVVDRIITGTTYETTRYKTCTKCGGHGKWME